MRPRLLGALCGLLAAATALAVSEAVAALLDGVTSPFYAVGNRFIDQTPQSLKEFAIAHFGTADKPILIGGVLAMVAVVAAVAGIVGVRRPRLAVAVFGVLGLVAALAALTDRAATAGPVLRLVPAVALLLVGVASLVALLRAVDGQPARRPSEEAGPIPTTATDRRRFLITAGAVAAVTIVGGVVARGYGGLAAAASRAGIRLPKARRPAPPVPNGVTVGVEGVTPYLTANAAFYRVDTALQVPDVPVDGWRLRVHGMVDRELSLSYDDLLARDLVERRVTLTCVSNPVGGDYLGNAVWLGVPMHELLEEAGVKPGADAVKSTSADDFTAGTPLAVLLDKQRGAMVAVGMNGEPLPLKHGFPARMVTPGLYGYVSATKWLVDLEATRFADFKAYWTTRGYSAVAPIKPSSRIDVPRSFAHVKAGRTPVAGVAWSQARGVDRVEVRVDQGDWHIAELGTQDGVDTWRQWVWHWNATPGNHTIEVRATDATGYTQTSTPAPIAPNGSTGWDSVNVTVS